MKKSLLGVNSKLKYLRNILIIAIASIISFTIYVSYYRISNAKTLDYLKTTSNNNLQCDIKGYFWVDHMPGKVGIFTIPVHGSINLSLIQCEELSEKTFMDRIWVVNGEEVVEQKVSIPFKKGTPFITRIDKKPFSKNWINVSKVDMIVRLTDENNGKSYFFKASDISVSHPH